MNGTHKLHAALDLAKRGYRVFPLTPGTAIPRAELAWKSEATTDEAKVRAWWSEADWNIGVATGSVTVIDLDVKGGKNGLVEGLKLGLDLDTFTVRTPSGGLHLYHSDGGYSNKAGTLELPNGEKAKGVDIRGVGGYVVGPGSVTPVGRYVIENDAPLTPLPASWVSRLTSATKVNEARSEGEDHPAAIDTAERYLKTTGPAIQGQGGDATTVAMFMRLRDYGLTEDTAYEMALELWNERCEPPWEPEDLRLKAKNAFRYSQNATPSRDAADMVDGLEALEVPEFIAPPPVVEKADRWSFMTVQTESKRPPPEWLVKRTLPKTGLAAIWGPSGSGKSLVAQDLMVAVGAGGNWLGSPIANRGGTLLLASEAAEILAPRLKAADVGPDSPLIWADTPGFFRSDTPWEDFASIINAGRQRLADEFGAPLRIVVIDTLSASGGVQDENDNAEMQRAASSFSSFAKKAEVLIVLVHHSEKTGKEMRGASALRGALDSSISVNKAEGRLRNVRLDKCRRAVERDLGVFTVEEQWFKDADGDQDSVPLLTWVSEFELPDIRPRHAETLLNALKVHFDRGPVGLVMQEFEALSGLKKDVTKTFNDTLAYLTRKGEIAEELGVLTLCKTA